MSLARCMLTMAIQRRKEIPNHRDRQATARTQYQTGTFSMSFDVILPFLRPIAHLIQDPAITEIMVNAPVRSLSA